MERALEEAARAGLLREIDRDGYAFDHALTQQSLYGELPTRRRRRLHLAAGEAIEQTREQKREGRAAELAWHFLEGDEPGRALPCALMAGDGAESIFAHSDAELHFRTALQLARELGDRGREVEALEKLGNVLFMLARYREELDVLLPALQIYRETEDIEGEMRTAAAIGWAYFEVAQRREGVEFLTLVLSRWGATTRGASSAAASLHISLGNLHWADGNGEEALPLFVRGAELADAVGDNRLLGLAESRRGAQLEEMARIDEGLEAYDRSIHLSELTGDLDTLSRSLNNRSMLYGFYRRDWVRAEADLERQIEVARQLAKPAQLAFGLKSLGQRYWATGEWARARPLLEEAAQIVRRLGVSRSGESITLAAVLRLMSGEVESATRELEECVTSARERRDTEIFGSAQKYLAQWDLRNHRPAEALKRMEEVLGNPDLEKQFRTGPTTLLAIALAQEGELERAEILVSEGLAEARRSGFRPSISQWCIATGNVRASQGRWDESRAAFGEALTIAHTGGATFIGATVLHDCALMEALAGNLAEARARFEEELTLLRPMGATALIDQTESELAHLAESREPAN